MHAKTPRTEHSVRKNRRGAAAEKNNPPGTEPTTAAARKGAAAQKLQQQQEETPAPQPVQQPKQQQPLPPTLAVTAMWDFTKRTAFIQVNGKRQDSLEPPVQTHPKKAGASKVEAAFIVDGVRTLVPIQGMYWEIVGAAVGSAGPPLVRTFGEQKK